VQYLECGTVAVAVRGFVYRGHTAQPKEAIQSPFVAEELTFALSRQEVVRLPKACRLLSQP
jgi:hypothetical protein